ncbi:hypothetical protein EV384_0348 [Micromonospora kangleipakensis]|uniref:Uncharacterized protein n=1 Tax=Micromonospora kangleipakensis TaxID=1077942 RepID=A0A4Q8B5E3_9ACTN|nr:hypothetical protein EV384_0348 [Micromonospora kangleipakensis]
MITLNRGCRHPRAKDEPVVTGGFLSARRVRDGRDPDTPWSERNS